MTRRSHSVSWLLAAAVLTMVVVSAVADPSPVRASAATECSGEYLAEGANWSVCWEIRAHEGLAITHAFYTMDGFDRRVLSDAALAQMFVPYEAGQPRYHDVAYGMGAAIQTLSPVHDCPDGTLLGAASQAGSTDSRTESAGSSRTAEPSNPPSATDDDHDAAE